MFFLEPGRTQFDLNWRMFGIPVRVHPMFWIISAAMGWSALEDGFQFLLLWVACVFVSILVHEMGHVVMGRLFGSSGHIVLYSFGGLAVGSNTQPYRWQRIAVSFAGPLAGFLLFGVLLAGVAVFAPRRFDLLTDRLLGMVGLGRGLWMFGEGRPTLVGEAINDLFWINLRWGLVNLLPVWPLDGGQISRELCTWASPGQGVRASLAISGVVAALIALDGASEHFWHRPLIPHFPSIGGIYTAIFFGLLALSSFMAMQQVPQGQRPRRSWDRDADDEDRLPWERDPDYWKQGRDPWRE